MDQERTNRSIIKVSTSIWHDKGGIHCKRSYSFRKRLSKGVHFLEEDSKMVGGDETFRRIVNPNVEDGLYSIELTNVCVDWEEGCMEDYDFLLVPYESKN